MNRITFRSLVAVPVLLVLLSVPSIALADGITWTLSGVTFDDTGTASGSFVFDTVAKKFNTIDITTTLGSAFAGAEYKSLSGAFGSSSSGMLLGSSGSNLTNTPLLLMMFGGDLTNSGGMVSVIDVEEGTCNDPRCRTQTLDRSIVLGTTGTLIPTPVATPEPSTFLLMGTGLVALLAGAAIRKVLYA